MVIAVAQRKAGLKVSLLDRGGDVISVSEAEFVDPPDAVANVALPSGFAARQRDDRETVAFRLRRLQLPRSARAAPTSRDAADAAASPVNELHPVERDPDLQRRLRAAAQADRVAQEIVDLRQRIGAKHHSLSEEFDRVLSILNRYGYVDDATWTLTDDGAMLAQLFHECDLLVAEALRLGLLDGLRPAEIAALVSTFVYEHRSPEPAPPAWFPSAQVRRRWESIVALSDDLQATERSAGLPAHRAPDPTFAAVAYAWVAGEPFADVVRDEDLTGGDFVRTTRQLVDLLSQIALVAPSVDTRTAAAAAADAARRGVVADSAGASGSSARSDRTAGGGVAPMTIKPGQSWGRTVARPDDLVFARSDAEAAALLASGCTVALAGGDLHRTVGGRAPEGRDELLELPVDLIDVVVDDATSYTAIAHVLARHGGRSGWWRGEIVAVMNAEFIGAWDVAPRSHPNDGRADVTRCPASFGLRDRLQAQHRLPVGGHLPHPALETSVITRRQPEADRLPAPPDRLRRR